MTTVPNQRASLDAAVAFSLHFGRRRRRASEPERWKRIMSHKVESLLQDAGRARELAIGWVCALVSGAFTSLLGWLVYVVAWRHPRQYDVHDLQKGSTLAVLGVLLAVAVGFGVLASRLIRHRRTEAGLMSPTSLRIWGSFFALASVLVLIHAVVNQRWLHVLHLWTLTAGAASMAVAAFALARRRERRNASPRTTSQQGGAANRSQPVGAQTTQTSGEAGSGR